MPALTKSVLARVSREAKALVAVLHFALYGKHPHRGEIVRAYLRLCVQLAFSGRSIRSFTLLGTEITLASDPGKASSTLESTREFRFLFSEIFLDEIYFCEHPSDTIIDCGSNIGMSILFFRSLWPNASIKGIEASPKTFAVLAKNVKNMPGVQIFNNAVSDRHGAISIFSDTNSLASSTNALRGGCTETLVEAVPLSDFITGPVDLLKIDIEGSEFAVFEELEASGRMRLVRQMFIEYHHHLPGEGRRLSLFLDRLERCGFEYELAATMPQLSGDFQDLLIRAKRIG